MSEHDPIEELRDAWRGLDAPDPTPREVDTETEQVLSSLRSAWDALEAPALPPGLLRPAPAPIAIRPRRNWRPLQVAAALLLIASSAYVARRTLQTGEGETQQPLSDHVALAEPTLPSVPAMPEAPQPLPKAPATQPLRAVESAAIEDGIVIQYGSVRLVMLTPEPNLDSFGDIQATENSK